MKRKHLYLILAAFGFFGPHYFFISFLYLVALLAVGLSFALPLFLYVRESCVELSKANADN